MDRNPGPEIFDYIPRDKRPGFRGFVEFDRATERDLRRAESPQHERFDRRVSGVKAIIAAIESKVREFAEEQGWSDQESTRPAPESDREVALDFLRFLSPRGRPRSNSTAGTGQLELNFTERWECDLQVGLPTSQSTRVDWGQTIRNVVVMVKIEPPAPSQTSTVSLELTRVGGNTPPTVVATQRVGIQMAKESPNSVTFRLSPVNQVRGGYNAHKMESGNSQRGKGKQR